MPGDDDFPGRRPPTRAIALALIVAMAGCGRAHAVGPAFPSGPLPWPPAVPATHEALSTVLAAMARFGPQQRWSGARNQVLAGYLAALARSGPVSTPELFPSPADRLAYALDAHMAWAIALGEDRGLRSRDVWALRRIPFPLDGGTSTLAALEAAAAGLAPYEPRVALFLNPGWRGGPRFPGASIEARSVEYQIDAQAAACGAAPGFWELERGNRVVRVSAFTDFLWGLPAAQPERARRLFELVPPPADLASAIVAACGASLMRCSIAGAPLDTARLFEPSRTR